METDREKMRVLIVVDVQQCFIEGTLGALPGHDQSMQVFKKRISDYVKRVKDTNEYDIIVFTKDSHPPNHSSFQIGHYPPHCSDRKKKACIKRTSYDSLSDPTLNIRNMSRNPKYSTFKAGDANDGDLVDEYSNETTDGYVSGQGKELVKEFEQLVYDEIVSINVPKYESDSKKELFKQYVENFETLDTRTSIDMMKTEEFQQNTYIVRNKTASKAASYIIRLNKGELCNFDANGAFYYHIQYKKTSNDQPLEPIDILNEPFYKHKDNIHKYSTGLAESIYEWRYKEILNQKKNSNCKIEFDVCGLVTNICVVKTCITGVNMFNTLYKEIPVSFKILNEYCYNLHLDFIPNAYQQIQDAGHGDKITFSDKPDAFGFHPHPKKLPPTYAISDPEGFNLYSLLHPSADKTKHIVVCGDLLDSTIQSRNAKQIPIIIPFKSFNLFNIHEVIKENSNITLTLGNRDINKIKCRYLCELNSEAFKGEEFAMMKDFNDGNIELSEDNCKKLSKACVKDTYNVMPWTHKMKNWYTFWNKGTSRSFQEFDDNYCQENYTASTQLGDKKGTGPFHKRFVDIFGADGAKGTMSADKLLETIPHELFGEKSKTYSNNYKAFIVLAVFKSMMIKETPKFDAKFNDGGVFVKDLVVSLNSSLFKGWLCAMYQKSVMCVASVVNNNLFLFSHAGMPIEDGFLGKLTAYSISDLSGTTAALLKDIDNAYKIPDIYTKLPQKFWSLLSGGSGSPVLDDIQTLNSIVENVEKYNTYFKNTLIMSIVNDSTKGSTDGVPSDIMIQLLAYTSGYSNETKKYSSASGPVNLSNWKTSKDHYKISGMKVHQIHGHSPQGFGCDITPLFNETEIGFYGSIVNLDNSNIFMSNNRRKYGNDNNKSYNYLQIDTNGEYTIDTSLLIDFEGFDEVTNTIHGLDAYTSKPLEITFSSEKHLIEKYKSLYSDLKTPKIYNNADNKSLSLDKKFSGFVENDSKIVIMTMEPPMKFFIHVYLEDIPEQIYTPRGGYSRRNRRNTNRAQYNRNSKRGYLTTTRKSRNQQKQNKTRKCTCASCRSMRR